MAEQMGPKMDGEDIAPDQAGSECLADKGFADVAAWRFCQRYRLLASRRTRSQVFG